MKKLPIRLFILSVLFSVFVPLGLAGGETGLVLNLRFDEGKPGLAVAENAIVRDESGNGNDGLVKGKAQWVDGIRGSALELDGGGYVDCGSKPSLNLTGALTLMAWIKAKDVVSPNSDTAIIMKGAFTYGLTRCEQTGRNRQIFGYLNDGGTHVSSFMDLEKWQQITLTYDPGLPQQNLKLYINGIHNYEYYKEYTKAIATNAASVIIGKLSDQYFHGSIDEVRIYNRALSTEEIQTVFRETAKGKGELTLTPYYYRGRNELRVMVDANRFVYLPDWAVAEITLCGSDGKPIRQAAGNVGCPKRKEYAFTGMDYSKPAGEVVVRLLDQQEVIARANLKLVYPEAVVVQVPAPEQETLPALLSVKTTAPFKVDLRPGGGFVVQAAGNEYAIESSFSYPDGGTNRLLAAKTPDRQGEASLKVETRQLDATHYQVKVEGQFYVLQRDIALHANRINVKDTITNKQADDFGLILGNEVRLVPERKDETFLAGYQAASSRALNSNPTVFLKSAKGGLGLVALDDVYIIQAKGRCDKEAAGIYSENFALGKKAAYTLEWSVYPIASGDYYDFINQIRKDEDRNGTFDGGFTGLSKSPFDRRMVPSKEFIELRGATYGMLSCLAYPADDPEVEFEGIEFMDYPLEKALLRLQLQRIHQMHPGLKATFHVAHSIFATNKPEEIFADSRVILANGQPADYCGPQGYSLEYYQRSPYFSAKRAKEGWRWAIYYPTLENSFGKKLLQCADVMADELGCRSVFMDGFMIAYGGAWTYDRWDGHSAEIDPQTKRLMRKTGSVLLLSQDALAAFARKLHEKGVTVIGNNAIFTRTICKEKYILYDNEGPLQNQHGFDLSPTPVGYGGGADDAAVYNTVYKLLAIGHLFIHSDEEITRKSIFTEMYPFTFEEIHSGYVKGTQRLITAHSGLYGWAGDDSLHLCHLYDEIGCPIPNTFLTTVDRSGIRTRIDLKKMQMALCKKIPVSLRSPAPVNVHIRRYESQGLELTLNGKGKVELCIRTGDFPIAKGSACRVWKGSASSEITPAGEVLTIPVDLKGELTVRVDPKELLPAVKQEASASAGAVRTSGEPALPGIDLKEIKARAEKGDAMAQFQMGLVYETAGSEEAEKWYRQAAEQGHEYAQYLLGALYRDGREVKRDCAETYKWFTLASERGNKVATEKLRYLARDMTADELVEGKRRIASFVQKTSGSK